MEEKSQLQKQKELLTKIINEGHVIPELNLLTLNIKEVYCRDGYSDVDADRMVDQFNKNEQYCNYINFLYDKEIRNAVFSIRNNNNEHNGTRSTMKTSKHKDIEVYFLEGFNYNALTPDEKIDLEEYLCFLDSIWEMRDGIYEKEEKVFNKLLTELEPHEIHKIKYRPPEIRRKIENLNKQNEICINKMLEDNSYTWRSTNNFDTLYKIHYLLRHGIIGKLGFMDKEKYYNVKELFLLRSKQLKEMSDCLKNLCNTNIFITDDEKNDTTDYINFLDEEYNTINSIKFILEIQNKTQNEKDKEYVLNSCNLTKWGMDDKRPGKFNDSQKEIIMKSSSKIDLNTIIFNSRNRQKNELIIEKILTKDIDILYDFVDPFGDYIDKEIPYCQKQFLYGFYPNIEFYKDFKNYFNINPWGAGYFNYNKSEKCYRNLIRYSGILNKLNVYCISKLDVLFPLRFIFNRPYDENGSINKYIKNNGIRQKFKYKYSIKNEFLQKISVSNKPNLIIDNKIIGYIKFRGSYINYIILKGERRIKHDFKGIFSSLQFTNNRLEKMDINNVIPTQNVSWDEFNIIYNYLKKPVYIYNPNNLDIDELLIRRDKCNTTFTLFVHNDEYRKEIPIHLINKLKLVDDIIYQKLNLQISYKDYVQNQLTIARINILF